MFLILSLGMPSNGGKLRIPSYPPRILQNPKTETQLNCLLKKKLVPHIVWLSKGRNRFFNQKIFLTIHTWRIAFTVKIMAPCPFFGSPWYHVSWHQRPNTKPKNNPVAETSPYVNALSDGDGIEKICQKLGKTSGMFEAWYHDFSFCSWMTWMRNFQFEKHKSVVCNLVSKDSFFRSSGSGKKRHLFFLDRFPGLTVAP